MKASRKVLGAAVGAAGVAAAGAVLGQVRQRRETGRLGSDDTPFGTLRSRGRTVVASDGVPLYVEVDEIDPAATPLGGRAKKKAQAGLPFTVVFSHGYALNLDCWHFQRAAYRGLVRAVYYDQRSHGRSGRSVEGHATIDQLADDLLQILDVVVPEGPVVLVGHSMGGMTIVTLLDQHPELLADRVVGVGLISTTAGGFDPSRVLLPMLPAKLGGELTLRTVRTLSHGHPVVDRVRRLGHSAVLAATDLFAFGGEVPTSYINFVDKMLAATPFEVVAEFFPSFRALDKFHTVGAMGRVPTTIICGTADRLTSIGHSRKLHQLVPGSTLVECPGAGHMVLLERHAEVNAALDQLLTAAAGEAGSR